MYPIQLPGEATGMRYQDHTSSFTNPDGLAFDGSGPRPDPIGRAYLRLLDFIEHLAASIRVAIPRLHRRRQPANRLA